MIPPSMNVNGRKWRRVGRPTRTARTISVIREQETHGSGTKVRHARKGAAPSCTASKSAGTISMELERWYEQTTPATAT